MINYSKKCSRHSQISTEVTNSKRGEHLPTLSYRRQKHLDTGRKSVSLPPVCRKDVNEEELTEVELLEGIKPYEGIRLEGDFGTITDSS